MLLLNYIEKILSFEGLKKAQNLTFFKNVKTKSSFLNIFQKLLHELHTPFLLDTQHLIYEIFNLFVGGSEGIFVGSMPEKGLII